jgi:hypothetical protein
MYALAATPGENDDPVSYPYSYKTTDPTGITDITSGNNNPNNNTCAVTYVCNAGPGYDGPSGLGTPNGVGALQRGVHILAFPDVTTDSAIQGSAYSSQLSITGASGPVTYAQTRGSSVNVSSTGHVTAPADLANGVYEVAGTDSDTGGDTGYWTFTLDVGSWASSLTIATVPAGTAYSGTLVGANTGSAPSFVQKTGFGKITVASSGAVSAPSTLAPGTYHASGYGQQGSIASDFATAWGWWNVTLTVQPGAGPAVSGLTPKSGPVAGGTAVTINGTGFTGATGVTFGSGAPGTAVHVVSGTQITVTAPHHAAGTVNVRVTTPAGVSALATGDVFTYAAPMPVISSIAPTSGPIGGGSGITINGTGFTGATVVAFGNGNPSTEIHVVSDTQLTATSPAHAAGAVNIRVTTPGGTSAVAPGGVFTYKPAVATVASLSPGSGVVAGGTSVVITGTGFTGASKVEFGNGVPAASFHVDSATQITAVSPSHAAGVANVFVTTPAGKSAAVTGDVFTWKAAAPTITSLSPKTGPAAGGTSVVITGTGFTGATAVVFGNGAPAVSFHVDSATQITAVSPDRAAGAVNVKVTGPTGSSATTTGDVFTYQPVVA